MITKQIFIENVLREIEIIKHLSEKITEENIHYKPTEKQRSIRELLGYLSVGPVTALKVAQSGDAAFFAKSQEEQQKVTLENFKETVDKEGKEIKDILENMTDEELSEEIDLWKSGMVRPRSEYILQLVLEAFVAYKMQLFLYLKSSGSEHLNTQNLWQGRDPEAKN